jgi:hypothetical protein
VDEGRIEKRIAELKAQREDFVKQANQQIAALNGAISALEDLLKPEETEGATEEGA